MTEATLEKMPLNITRDQVDGINIKYIPNTDNMFAVSKTGAVYSFTYKMQGRVIGTKGAGGYITCSIQYVSNKSHLIIEKSYRKTMYVHRLVAEAFIPNPEGKKQICHIDEDKTNNCVDNLCWVAAHEVGDITNHDKNLSAAIKEYYKTRNVFGRTPTRIAIFNIETNEVIEISPSIKAAGKWFREHTGKSANSSAVQISGILADKAGFKTCGGYGVRRATEEEYHNWSSTCLNKLLEEPVEVSEIQMNKLNKIPGVSVINRKLDVSTGKISCNVKHFEPGEKITNELQ